MDCMKPIEPEMYASELVVTCSLKAWSILRCSQSGCIITRTDLKHLSIFYRHVT